jgi:hypothetical protein
VPFGNAVFHDPLEDPDAPTMEDVR